MCQSEDRGLMWWEMLPRWCFKLAGDAVGVFGVQVLQDGVGMVYAKKR